MAEQVTMTVLLRTVLTTKLLTYSQDIAFGTARGSHAGAFIVYDLDEVTSDEVVKQYNFVVDCVSQGQNTTAIETLADQVWEGLDHWYYLDNDFEFTCYQSVRNNIAEDNFNHRRLSFVLRLIR